ncbi:MAG: DUF1697 domain-containing protein, partial [bacterium]
MRQAAFLRAINVGTHNRIKMADLKDVCQAAGFENVSTYLQTGNLLFESDLSPEEVATKMEAALTARGLRNADVIVRSQAELAALLKSDPFEKHPRESFRQYVTLFRRGLPANAAEVAGANPLNILVRKAEICSVRPIEVTNGPDLNGNLEKKLKVPGTTRYWH